MDAAWLFFFVFWTVADLTPSIIPASACGQWRKCAPKPICAVDYGMLVAEASPRPAGASLDGVCAVLFVTQHKVRSMTGWQKILSHFKTAKDPWDVTLLSKS